MKKCAMLVLVLLAAVPARTQVAGNGKGPGADDLRHVIKDLDPKDPKVPQATPAPVGKNCPAGSQCASAPFVQAVVHGGYAYLWMDPALASAVSAQSQGWLTASLNGVRVAAPSSRIKTMDNVIYAVSGSGANSEAIATKEDLAALFELGAKLDVNGNLPGREYLKFKLAGPVSEILIELRGGKTLTKRLTTILYF